MSKTYSTTFQLGGQLSPTFSKAFQKAAKGTDGVSKGVQHLQQEGKAGEGAFGKLSKAAMHFGKTVGKVAEFTGAYALVSGIAESFTNLIGSVGAYQSSMRQVQAATGLTADEMVEIQKMSKTLYNQNLGEDFDDLANAITKARQVTQQQGDALQATTRNALVFRDVFGEDIPESVKAADTMMRNFKITSDESFNLLAQGAQKGLDKSGELLDTANEYAPHFASLGFTANQMFDTFSAGLESGAFNLDKVGDAVKEFNIRSKDGSKGTAEAFQSLGMDANRMAQTFARGGPEAQAAFQQVVKTLSELQDPVEKNTIGVQLFGTQFEDLEKDVIAAMGSARSQFDMTKDTMNEIVQIKYDTVGMAFRGIGRQIMTGLIIPIGDRALPLLQTFSNWINTSAPKVKAFFGTIGDMISPVIAEARKLSSMVYDVAANATKLVASLFGNEINIDTWSALQSSLVKLGFSQEQAYEWTTKFTAGFIKARDIISTVIGELGSGIKMLLTNTVDIWSQWLPSMISFVKQLIPYYTKAYAAIGSAITNIIPLIFKISAAVQTISAGVVKAIAPVVAYVISKVVPILTKIVQFVGSSLIPAISGMISALLPKIVGVAGKIIEAFNAIWSFVRPMLDFIVAAFNWAFPVIKSIVLNAVIAVGGIINGLLDVFGGIIDFITGVFSGNWEKAWIGVKEIFTGIFRSLGAVLAFPINLAIDAINAAIGSINKIRIDVPDWVPGFGGKTFSMNIPTIAKIQGYANGGIVSSPELAWVGEGGDTEVIIPMNNSARSYGLYEAAGRMLGVSPSASTTSTTGDFIFSPTYQFYGNADEKSVQQMEQRTRSDFKKEFEAYKRQQMRVSFG